MRRKYNVGMTREEVLAFVNRDWAAVERSKIDFWAERYRAEGAAPARAAADALWRSVRQAQPDYPNTEDRARDYADHLALCDKLDRAARAFARR